jgi:hypothetical protein
MYLVGSLFRSSVEWKDSTRLLRVGAGALSITVLFIMTFDWYAQLLTDDFGYFGYGGRGGEWIPFAIFFNLLFVGYLVFVMLRAIRFEEYEFAFTVVRMFALYFIVKYFTLFYDMFDTGLLLMVGGVLFIGAGWVLEKYRRVVIEYFKTTSAKDNPVLG